MKMLILLLLLIFAPSLLILIVALFGIGGAIFAGFVAAVFLIMGIVKVIKKIRLSKLKPIYDEQLCKLGPKAQFFADARPLVEKENIYSSVESSIKRRGELKNIAIKYGLDPETASLRILYGEGARIIFEAQEKYVLQQDNGRKMMFYLCLPRKLDHTNLLEAAKGLSGYLDDIVMYAEEYSILDFAGYKKPIWSLRDDDALTVVNAYKEGASVCGNLKQRIPYYYEWLCCDYDRHGYDRCHRLNNFDIFKE